MGLGRTGRRIVAGVFGTRARTLLVGAAAATALLFASPGMWPHRPLRAEPADPVSHAATHRATGRPRRAMVMGSHPVWPLEAPEILVISGQGRPTEVVLDGPPAAWVEAINRASGRTGVEAMLTGEDTLLDDGTPADPAGQGYLLLWTRERGRSTAIAVRFPGPSYATGFTVTDTTMSGED